MNLPTWISQSRSGRFSILGAALLTVAASFTVASASAEAAEPYWAKVTAAGGALAVSGVTKITHFGHGRYDLIFSHSLSSCALTGTVNTSGGSDPGPGSASILLGEVSSTELFVRTATPSGSGAATVDDDRPFSVLVICP
jgi:hypothetical protein